MEEGPPLTGWIKEGFLEEVPSKMRFARSVAISCADGGGLFRWREQPVHGPEVREGAFLAPAISLRSGSGEDEAGRRVGSFREGLVLP